jgi:DNA-binding transcriptional LysR family regulator
VDLSVLATFVKIVERGSLSGAARATGQSLPTVSRQLRALEAELDVALALRTTRRLTVTEDGLRLAEHARRALAELELARHGVGARAEQKLVLSVPVTLGQHLVVPKLATLLKRRPGLKLEIRLEDRVAELLAENVDVVVRAGVAPPDSAELIARPLATFRRVAVASRSYLRARGTPKSPRSLSAHECLLQVVGSGVSDTWALARGDRIERVRVAGRVASTAPQVLLEAARSGLGVALLPAWLVEEDLRARRLVRLLTGWQSAEVTAYALYRTGLRGAPALDALLEALGSRVG